MPRARSTFRAMLLGLWALPLPWLASVSRAEQGDLSIEPAAITIAGGGSRQQILVTSRGSDGTARDLSRQSRYRVEPADLAVVDAQGILRPRRDGDGMVRIEADGGSASAPVHIAGTAIERPVSYRQDVAALLTKAGCNSGPCHGNITGKGGFRLSLRGDDPAFDLDAMARDLFGRRVDRQTPDSSLIYRKPTGLVPHEGGPRFTVDSAEARALLAWIAGGAGDDLGRVPKLTGLEVSPSERYLAAPGLQQQLIVTATFADGTTRDVTAQAAYDVNDPTRASVGPAGLVEARGPGETVVAVRYLDGRAVSRLAFLHERPDFAWRAPAEKTPLDKAVFAKLRALRIRPSEPASDAVFLRRAYLDAIGVLPTAEETRAFLDDPSPGKRAALVDRLLARDEFADFWALKWADLLRNEEKVMGEKGVWIVQRWIRDQIAVDRPLDEFARSILTARGSTWRNPPASFYRTNRDAQTAAEAFGQIFLGIRLQCAKCHNHPFDVWTQDDYYALAATFANVGRKTVNNVARDQFDKHEINGDEIVYIDGRPRMKQPRTGMMMDPKPPGGDKLVLDADPAAVGELADWLTRDNPQFARNMANRVWFHLIGRGVVDPVDDFRESNPPSNPALLDALAEALVADGMRLRPLVRLIMTSAVYELAARPDPTAADDEANFAHATVRLLPAEVLLDILGQALGERSSFEKAPPGARAVQLSGVRGGGPFLKTFGKPDRLLTCECERSEATNLAQSFQMINGPAVRRMLTAEHNRLGRLIASGWDEAANLEDLYLGVLNRRPTATESAELVEYLRRADDRRRAWEDVAWALINSKEFLLRH